MKNQNNRLHKTETEAEKLLKQLKELLKKHDADEVFTALVSASSKTTDEDYLKDEVISYLNIWQGLNVVKLNGLNQQIEFEEKMQNLFPFDNDRQTNLFLTY